MGIHHATLKKAEKAGFTLTEEGDQVVAFWPKRALRITGASASDAMAQMQAAQVVAELQDVRVVPDTDQPRLVTVHFDGLILKGSPMPPVAAHKIIMLDKTEEWVEPAADYMGDTDSGVNDPPKEEPAIERINGIAVDGAVAFAEGTPAGDCPYSSETEDEEEYANFERWNQEWDDAADAKQEEEDAHGGSVVSERYRVIYAERGHPTHCGDWLATTLNELVLNKGGTNIELFEDICGLNGVSLAKYNRTAKGWEGRLRMTGRNLLARVVFLNDGILKLPPTLHGGQLKAPGEWMTQQRFKKVKKAEAEPAAPTGVININLAAHHEQQPS